MKTKLLLLFVLGYITIQGQNVNIPDNEFKQALLSYSPSIDTNNDGQISYTEAAAVTVLNISNYHYQMTGGDPNDPMGGAGVEVFGISDFTGIEAFINLTSLTCKENDLTSLDVSALTQLSYLDCSNNINPMGWGGGISTLTLPNSSALTTLKCSGNHITSLDVSNYTNLTVLNCSSNNISTLTLPNSNTLTDINVSRNAINNINVSAYTNLNTLNISYNSLTGIDLSTNNALTSLNAERNNINNITLPAAGSLTSVRINNNQLTALDISTNTSLTSLICHQNQITALDVSTNISLTSIICHQNQITELNLSYLTSLTKIICNNNSLTSLNIKNGNNTAITTNNFDARNNSNLNLICVDDPTYATNTFTKKDATAYYSNICSFIPPNSNTIVGRVSFDFDNNGCSNTDTGASSKKIKTTGSNTGNVTFTDANGEYLLYTQEAVMNTEIIPNLPSFFSVTPTSQSTTFSGSGNTQTIDFCISANSQVNDVKVQSFPISESRPGFNNTVRVFYENIGSTTLNGTVTLNFENNKEVFSSASITPNTQTASSLTWNYTNLQPFEQKYIDVTFTINTPTDPTNPVNGGDTLTYTTTITTDNTDVNPNDNTHYSNVIVINSYDPNDVTCFEGDKISLAQVPNDLTYRIRFQNTGSASAINIVVKDIFDTDLDMDTFQPIGASHSYRISITDTNKVEFIFENINLADSTSNEPASHGWILYKIKPKTTAVIGSVFENTANIYFDYNAPITTNTATTTVSTVISIPDSNFEQALIDLGHDRGTINNVVFTDNINGITNLDISNKNIADLTGIEHFTALTNLDCYNNVLTTVNLSQNTNLIHLDIQNNQLTDLNMKNGNNTNISNSSFKTTNNPNLKCIEVDNATWSSTNWTNIDASSNFVNNQAECVALSIGDFDINKFKLYPNPVKNTLTINSTHNSTYLLYDIRGKLLKKGSVNTGNNELNLQNLESGMYLIKINHSNKKVFVTKFLKE